MRRSTTEPYGGIVLGGVLGNMSPLYGYFEALTMLSLVAIEFIIIVVGPHDPERADMPWLQSFWILFASILTGIVQGFYVWRLYRLSRNAYALFALVVLFIVKCVTSCVVITWVAMGLNKLFLKNVWFVALYMRADATLDLAIAGGTTTYLYRNRTGFKSTDTAIKRMVKYSISTGLATSIASLIAFVMFIMVGFTVSGVTIQAIAVRLHAMAWLGSLHMRSSFRDLARDVESIHVPLSLIRRTDGQVLRRRSVSTPRAESTTDGMQSAENREKLPIESDAKAS